MTTHSQTGTRQSEALSGDVSAAQAPQLTRVLDLIDVEAPRPNEQISVAAFGDVDAITKHSKGAMVAAGLRVFLDAADALDQPLDHVDKTLLDAMIADLDDRISAKLNDVMHHPTFQHLESSWRGLKMLVDRTDFRRNVRIELLNASKDALRTSFEERRSSCSRTSTSACTGA